VIAVSFADLVGGAVLALIGAIGLALDLRRDRSHR